MSITKINELWKKYNSLVDSSYIVESPGELTPTRIYLQREFDTLGHELGTLLFLVNFHLKSFYMSEEQRDNYKAIRDSLIEIKNSLN